MSSRVLTIHLVEGTANGLQTAEIDNWIGEVFVAPKPDLPNLLKQPELQGLGVYVLVGDDPNQSNQSIIYIGQGQVKDRLTKHTADQDKDFWDNKTVAIVAKNGSLNTADCHYLESRLISLAQQSGFSTVRNIQNPNLPYLAPTDKTRVENFLEQIQVLLPVLNINFFAPPIKLPQPLAQRVHTVSAIQGTQPVATPPSPAVLPLPPRFVLTTRSVSAEAELVSNRFVVLKGGIINANEKQSIGKSYSALRSRLRAIGKLIDDAKSGRWISTDDIEFSSPSAAAAVICGYSVAGPTVWVVKNTTQTYGQWSQAQINAMPIVGAAS